MAREKKLEAPVTLFAAIEAEQHARLRSIAYEEHRSLADVVRQAIDEYIAQHAKLGGPGRSVGKRAKAATGAGAR